MTLSRNSDVPRPVFIMGSARSGTTWLANILACHPDAAAATAVEHHGMHESHVYDFSRYCFPDCVSCAEFFAAYHSEDYYRIVKPDVVSLCRQFPGEDKVVNIFRAMMDDYARRAGCRCWLEKTPKHTIYFDEIARDFPDAKFVAIERDFLDTVRSNFAKYPRHGASRLVQLAEKVFRYESDRKAIGRLCVDYPDRVCRVSYEDLVGKYEETVLHVLDFIGLEPRSLKSEYAGDSSYRDGRLKPDLSRFDRMAMTAFRIIFGLLPYPVIRRIRVRRDRKQATGLPRMSRLAGDSG